MPPQLPLKRKLETALLGYLRAATQLDAQGWFFCHGAYAGVRKLPRIVVHVESATPDFAGALPNWCDTAVYVFSQIDAATDGTAPSAEAQDVQREDAETRHDAALQLVELAMQNGEAMAGFVNKGNMATRPVSGFYLYEAVENGQQTDIENRQFGNCLRYKVLCEAQDN